MVIILSMQVLMMRWLLECYTYLYIKQVVQEESVQSVQACMAEYQIDNRSVYDILDQISKDINLYPYVKQHKFNRDERVAFLSFTPGG